MKMPTHLLCRAIVMLVLIAPVYSMAKDTAINISTKVSGNQEQPKVLYIVPWQPPSSSKNLKLNIDSSLLNNFDHLERTELERQMHLLIESKVLQKNPQETLSTSDVQNTDVTGQE